MHIPLRIGFSNTDSDNSAGSSTGRWSSPPIPVYIYTMEEEA